MNLEELTSKFCKYLKLDNVKLMMLHTALATRLSQQMTGTPIWIIFIGPSGDAKSEIIVAMDDPKYTFMLHEITSNTLVSGFKKTKRIGKKFVPVNCDLAPQLDNKIVLIPDMAQILKLHPNEKAKVWAQLRELYDGRAGKKTGSMEVQTKYEHLRITFMACSTPAIDSQILIHQDLGTRELIFRTNLDCDSDEESNSEIVDKVWKNEECEDLMRTDFKVSMCEFFKDKKIKTIEISDEIKNELSLYVEVLRNLRASAEIDSFSGELINVVYPEQPTRSLKQLKRIFIALKSLDNKYPDVLALQVIRHIIKSSCSSNRCLVLTAISKYAEKVSVNQLGQDIKLGTKTIYKELNILWNLKLIERIIEHKEYYGKNQDVQYWKYLDTPLNQKIKEIFAKNPDTPDNKSHIYFSISTFFYNKNKNKNNNIIPSCQTVYHDTPNNNSSPDVPFDVLSKIQEQFNND